MKEKRFYPTIKARGNTIESNEIPKEENHEEKQNVEDLLKSLGLD